MSSGEDTLEDCTEKCGKHHIDKAEKVMECNMDCYLQYPSARSITIGTCNTACAEEAERTYDKEMKDSGTKDCKKGCTEGDGEDDDDFEVCKKACKDAEDLAKKAAEDEAEKDYKKCNSKCYEVDYSFKVGYVA